MGPNVLFLKMPLCSECVDFIYTAKKEKKLQSMCLAKQTEWVDTQVGRVLAFQCVEIRAIE